MGLCCSGTCEDEEPARQPLIDRGPGRRVAPTAASVLRQPSAARSSTTASFGATPSHSWISPLPQPKILFQNAVLDGDRKWFPQRDSLQSNVTTDRPARAVLINRTSELRASGVIAQPMVETSEPSSTYGTFAAPSNVSHCASVRICCNKEVLMELLPCFQTHHPPVIPKFSAYELEPLDKKSDRFVRKSLFRNQRFREIYEICRVKRVWNPYLMLQYMLNKCRYYHKLEECHMYHGTNLIAAHCIMEQNFNWRMVKEFTCGKGVYFANNPFLASHYGKKRNKGATEYYVMIVAKVLVEVGEIKRGFPHVIPEPGHSTTSKSKQEVIKFDDCFFYPEFLVYYKPIGT